jgi:ABC-2 type transport system ATP-binding protein
MSAVLSWSHVTKRFGSKKALDDFSLEVAAGQVFALLGDNGAGKSTAIRTLLGLIEPDQGQSSLLGLDSWRDGLAIRQQVGYVPDQPAFYEWMTIDQLGWFAAGFASRGFLPDYRRRIAHFRLDPRARVRSLSKGMRAKVGLALAVAGQPQVLVLDEPTSGLDVIVRREFLESMVDLAASGRTVLLSSHQISEVERVADTVAILHAGKVLVCDRVDTLKETIRAVHWVGEDIHPLDWPGEILSRETKGKQTRLILRMPAETHLAEAIPWRDATHVDIQPVSLEEIFVAYLTRTRDQAPTEVVAP